MHTHTNTQAEYLWYLVAPEDKKVINQIDLRETPDN
jgi:hypothetical protein